MPQQDAQRPDAGACSGTPAITVRFWGVRGSIPSPGPATVRYGGNTPCVEVCCGDAAAGGTRLVFDAGTGLRALGEALTREAAQTGRAVDVDLFLSHSHYDHVCGLPFFAPAYAPGSRLRVWAGHLGPGRTARGLAADMLRPPFHPVGLEDFRAEVAFRDFRCGDRLEPAAGVIVRTAPLNHPNGAVGYRVEHRGRAVCYVTDTEHRPGGLDPAVLGLVRGADAMIYDCTFSDAEFPRFAGWGHSTWEECLRLADAGGVGRAILFHHEPGRDDDALDALAAEADRARPGTLVAREGLTLAV